MNELTFEDVSLSTITEDGEVWVRGAEIGEALGYVNGRQEIHKIYTRNADEFTDSMTRTMRLPDLRTQIGYAGQMREVRMFSLRGAHLLAMFARTEKAKAFRRWVLDILDDIHRGNEYIMEQYRQAAQAFLEAKEVASDCGRGLNRWKYLKLPLEQRLGYWDERRQLTLSLELH